MSFRILAFVACLGALLGAGAGPAAGQSVRDCAVTALEGGNARVEQGGAWREASGGALPAAATRIETGPETRLEVTCAGGFVVTIGPESMADLGDLLRPDAEPGIVMALLQGILGIVAPDRTEGPVAVRTPAAIAAVRSTAWLVEHDLEARATAVFVREGRVTVSNREIAIVLRDGEGITLTADTVVRPVASWGQPRIEQSTGALGLGWD
jgi:ferric-dicitrate binding protein FerR (iron transport regulator)